MISSKQRAYLRSLAQNITPIFQVGKNGVTNNQIEQLINALEARELIKITLLDTTGADVVQIIGKKVTLYKRSTNSPKIELP